MNTYESAKKLLENLQTKYKAMNCENEFDVFTITLNEDNEDQIQLMIRFDNDCLNMDIVAVAANYAGQSWMDNKIIKNEGQAIDYIENAMTAYYKK